MKRKLFVISLIVCMTVSLCACQKDTSDGDKKETESTANVTKAPKEEATKAPKEEATETPTPKVTEEVSEESKEPSKEAEEGEKNMSNLTVSFDGNSYEMPISYQVLKDAGWSFNLADYGFEDGYSLDAETKTYGTIKLTNPTYKDSKFSVTVGFINTGKEAKDILDCDIWIFELDTCRAYTQAETYPAMEVAKGIKIGSSRQDVDAAFGTCDDLYEDKEAGYVKYNYMFDDGSYIKFTMIDDYGVTAIQVCSR